MKIIVVAVTVVTLDFSPRNPTFSIDGYPVFSWDYVCTGLFALVVPAMQYLGLNTQVLPSSEYVITRHYPFLI